MMKKRRPIAMISFLVLIMPIFLLLGTCDSSLESPPIELLALLREPQRREPPPEWLELAIPLVKMGPLVSEVENAGSKFRVTADIYLAGITDETGQGKWISAEAGYGGRGVLPTDASWVWFPAGYLGDAPGTGVLNNDVYGATLTTPAEGSYDVAVRFKVGSNYFTADTEGLYNPAKALKLDTFPQPLQDPAMKVNWCSIQWMDGWTMEIPGIRIPNPNVNPGQIYYVYAEVYKNGVTGVGMPQVPGNPMIAQLGIGKGNPITDDWTWIPATWNPGFAGEFGGMNNWEYLAALTTPTVPGTYRYAFRFRFSTGGWNYAGVLAPLGPPELCGELIVP